MTLGMILCCLAALLPATVPELALVGEGAAALAMPVS